MGCWDVYRLRRSGDNWLWVKALSIPEEDPLSARDTIFALLEILRRCKREGSPYRMVYCNEKVSRGADQMGFKVLSNAAILVLKVSFSDGKKIDVNKELSDDIVWSKMLDCVEEMPYTSTQLLTDFMSDFCLSRGAFVDYCEDNDVLARFRVVCPNTHDLYYM